MCVCVSVQHRVRSHSLQSRAREVNCSFTTHQHVRTKHLAHVRISIHRSQSVCGSGRLGIVKMWKNRVDRDETDLNRKQFDAFMEFCAIVPQDDAIAFLVVNLWGKRGRNRLFLVEPVGKTGRSARSRTESPRLPVCPWARARVRGGARLALARSSVIRAALRPRTQLLVLRATSSARPFCFC